jgi:disks large-associated protein 5
LFASARGQIRSVVGQAQLLMDQRFKQFSGLVDNCEFGKGEKETTTTDLTGFWEMIYFQVS